MTEYNTFILQMMLRNAILEKQVAEQQRKIEELQYENQGLNIDVGYLKDRISEPGMADTGKDMPHAGG